MKLHVAVGLFVITSIFIALYGVVSANAYREKLMTECMKDKKEYECYSMLRSTQPVVNNIQVGQ